MNRNFFGEPIPSNLDEINEALAENDMVLEEVTAFIEFNEDEGQFNGWTANFIEPVTDRSFTTIGYESKEQLIAEIKFAGVDHIEEI